MAGEASDAAAIAQNHNTVLPFGQPIDSTAAQSSIDRLIDAEFLRRLSVMSPDQQQVMQASGRPIEAGLSAQPLR